MKQSKSSTLFNFICYGGTMVKRIDFQSTEQFYQCPHANDLDGGFPSCKSCDGKMNGTVEVKIRFV